MKLCNLFKKGTVLGVRNQKDDTRKPLYLLYGSDSSGSMNETTYIVNENGESSYVPKIDQANLGFKKAVKSMIRFQKENVRFQIKYNVISFNTYATPLFSSYVSVNDHTLNETEFEANGSTNIEALFNTFCEFISRKHLGHYNRAVNIILTSDGVPTDVEGYTLSEERWTRIVDKFKAYLDENDFSRNVELYFIAIGDEAEKFGRYFAGDDHFFRVEECESIAEKLDFVTRKSMADSTTITTNPIDFSTDEKDYENNYDSSFDEDYDSIDENEDEQINDNTDDEDELDEDIDDYLVDDEENADEDDESLESILRF